MRMLFSSPSMLTQGWELQKCMLPAGISAFPSGPGITEEQALPQPFLSWNWAWSAAQRAGADERA